MCIHRSIRMSIRMSIRISMHMQTSARHDGVAHSFGCLVLLDCSPVPSHVVRVVRAPACMRADMHARTHATHATHGTHGTHGTRHGTASVHMSIAHGYLFRTGALQKFYAGVLYDAMYGKIMYTCNDMISVLRLCGSCICTYDDTTMMICIRGYDTFGLDLKKCSISCRFG